MQNVYVDSDVRVCIYKYVCVCVHTSYIKNTSNSLSDSINICLCNYSQVSKTVGGPLNPGLLR